MKNPNEDEKLIADHEYDGIHELDNPLPGWWLMTFYITIAFALVYFAYYTLGNGPTLTEELNKNMTRLEEMKPKKPKTEIDEAKLLALSKDPQEIKKGQEVFQARCVSCHGAKGEGVIGPNLTDNYWIHGKGTMPDVVKVISEGVNDKGMPAWGAVLKEDELYAVASYVKSLKGSAPPNPKAPQGDEVKE
ncbi:MAG: cbb3-type cytochrome c oxidase N-terminal domain-containing protein [bacterium]